MNHYKLPPQLRPLLRSWLSPKSIILDLAYCAFHWVNNVFTFTTKVKEILNVRFVYWLVSVFVVITWLQHRICTRDKHGMYFPALQGRLNFLTLPFLIHVPWIISLRFLFLLRLWLSVLGIINKDFGECSSFCK